MTKKEAYGSAEPIVKLLTEAKEFCDTLIAGIREGE